VRVIRAVDMIAFDGKSVVIEIDDHPKGTPNCHAVEVTAVLRRAGEI
jgi:hypothetical protein